MKEDIIEELLNKSIVLHKEHQNGFTADNRTFLLDGSPRLVYGAAAILWNKIQSLKPTVLIAKGIGGFPLLVAVRHAAWQESQVELRTLFVRDERKTRGYFRKLVEGGSPDSFTPSDVAVIVDDIIHAGRSLQSTVTALRDEGYPFDITNAAFLIDFYRLGSRSLTAQGWGIFSVVTRPELGLTRADPPAQVLGDLIWWRHKTNEVLNPRMPIKGTVVVHDGRIHFGMDNNHRMCLDAATGELIWRHDSLAPRIKGDVSVAAFDSGRVYWSSYDGTVCCADEATGELIWRVKTQKQVHCSPLLDSETNTLFVAPEFNRYSFYVGSGEMQALDMTTGRKKWGYYIPAMTPGTPMFDPESRTLIIGANNCTLYCLDADTGAFRWSAKTKGEQKGRSLLAPNGTVISVTNYGWVHSFNLWTGRKLWERRIGSATKLASPVLIGSTVIAPNSTGFVVGLDVHTGRIRWARRTRGKTFVGVTPVGDETVVATTDEGYIHRIHGLTGEKLATSKVGVDVGAGASFMCQPATIHDERIFIPTNNRGLFCYAFNRR